MKSRIFVYAFVLLTVLYLCATFLLPTDPATLERYQVSQLQLRLINLTVVVPLAIIWMVALYGFINLRDYALSVKKTKEGRAFSLLSIGLMILVFGLPLNALMGTVFRRLAVIDKDWLIPTTITRNYITLLFAMAAFTVLAMGAARLVRTFSEKKAWRGSYMPSNFAPLLVVLSAVFAWLITSKSLNQGADERVYFLPNWLLVFTIVIPYLLAWKAGMLATYYLYQYRNNVKGTVYKKAFADIAKGIAVIVFVSIFIQLITTSTAQLNRLNLTPILSLVYLLIIMYAVGFGFVARGAKKLKKIEEV